MTAALAILRRVPIWVWVVLAVLAWGGFQRHQAKSVERKHTKAVAEAAAQREAKLEEDAAETSRRLDAQKGITNEARQKVQALATDVERARAAERRLQQQLAAIQANPRPADSPASAGGQAAGETSAMLANMLSRCGARVRELAEYADGARTAGEACEKAYESLTIR